MTGHITQNISRELYWYICQNIVGTEKHVKRLRLLNAARDKLSNSDIDLTVTSGSFGEGIDLRGSDLDLMFIDQCVEVYDVKPHFYPNISYLSMDTDDVKPGYTQLILEYTRKKKLFEQCEQFCDKYYLSSTLWKIRLRTPHFNNIHGPCISDKDGIVDFAHCLHSKTWEPAAEHWIERSNNSWPNKVYNFSASMQYSRMDQHRFYVNDVYKTIESLSFNIANYYFFLQDNWTNVFFSSSINRGIQNVVSSDHSSIKRMYTYYISKLCSLRAQSIPLNSAYSGNKYQYQKYKSCICTLLQNIYHDAISGWLMLASFFYKTKLYTEALRVIMYSLSKCTFEKLYPSMELSDIHIHHQLFKLKSIQWKLIHLDSMIFFENSTLIPDELLIEVNNKSCLIPSSVYAYFLQFLCHYKLKNVRKCQDIIKVLQLVIEGNHLLRGSTLKAVANALLGVAFQIVGDTESARQAFLQSVELLPEPSLNSAKKGRRRLLVEHVEITSKWLLIIKDKNHYHDHLTQNTSIGLYWYLCQIIVGTEDHVKQIRLLNAARDNFSIYDDFISTTSGSYGEGLEMRGSDLDIMTVQRNMEVDDGKPHSIPHMAYLSMDTDDVKPGFTQLRLEYSSSQTLFDNFVQFSNKRYLSSTLLKQRIVMGSKSFKIHGPCVSDIDAYNLFGVALQMSSQSVEFNPDATRNPSVKRLFQ
ncbi:unnamed protein product [Mytilus coruscus]|uniref:Mab-21-like HhH/H2TH-like domain-containing protein n=1 Tax=Mytilus coruscus TaxID=42192 RepID=A0A6J7ZRJ9_MYTCO|nr:unnamed protein product [Mytilus coruscus]